MHKLVDQELTHCVPHLVLDDYRIIEYDIKIFVVDYRRRKIEGGSWNNLKKPKLTPRLLRHMWIHQARPTSQPSRLEGYVMQGTLLTVTIV